MFLKEDEENEMKNVKFIFVMFALAMLLGSLNASLAQSKQRSFGQGEGRPEMPPPMGAFHPRVFEQLDLSGEQREKIRHLTDDARAASTQYHEQMRANHDATKAIVEAENFNENTARQLIAKKTQLITELDLIRLRTDNTIYNLLTAEQKARFERIKQELAEPPPLGD